MVSLSLRSTGAAMASMSINYIGGGTGSGFIGSMFFMSIQLDETSNCFCVNWFFGSRHNFCPLLQ